MSYTLRGRVDSRLGALLPVLLAAMILAAALQRWWPIELTALMLGIGLVLDIQVYDRLLDYQPGWLAFPLGALELGLLMAVVRLAGIDAPIWPALGLFGAAWFIAQVLGHAGYPLLRLSYSDDGGELGRGGLAAAAAASVALVASGGFAYAHRPPVVYLAAGVHRGPLVITRREILNGRPGAVVRGGIVVRADDVTIRDVTVVGGENGITVDGYRGVKLERVTVSGAKLDGIHVRRAAVTIKDCTVDALGNPYGQGIDVSYTLDKGTTMISGCTVVGGMEGIVVHVSNAMLMHNTVSRTTQNGIAMTEMSMGMVERNQVREARGIGIWCNDHSICMVERNVVVDMRRDESGDLWHTGFGLLTSYNSEAEIKDNELGANPHPLGTVLNSVTRSSR
jgi:Right handed beta helix region